MNILRKSHKNYEKFSTLEESKVFLNKNYENIVLMCKFVRLPIEFTQIFKIF